MSLDKCSAVETRKNLMMAETMAKAGMDFVCIPVHGEWSKETLLVLMAKQLQELSDIAEIEERGV
ncbi:hypothetical protein 13VV501A_gene0006 [Vibrio phage 13VV501A]|nr:hypothetical protein 13VV501A_gene0006 [Vibrio phage 13VV501A]